MLAFDFHSPIERLKLPLFDQKEIRVDVKRDDLIHPFISGNKWRKLKYVLQMAQSQNKKHLVTFGGAWSNHIVATACAGAKFGFRTTAFIRGEQVSNPLLSLCKIFGMDLKFVTRTTYSDKSTLFDTYFGKDKQAFFINEGGHSAAGAQGCREIIEGLDNVYDHIFCACGTGTTLAGLYMEKTARSLTTSLHGVPVLAGGEFLKNAVAELYPQADTTNIVWHTDYHFGGYAKATTELIHFIQWFCANTGILIEPVYTGKLFYAVFDLIAKDYFQPNDKILIVHTGGLTGLLGMYERFA